MFQSLFQWISLCNSLWLFASIIHLRVSILVLVDQPLQQSMSWADSPARCSFNPCFSGLASATYIKYLQDEGFQSFNPCFSGLASATKIAALNTSRGCVFQSLFQWISLCNMVPLAGACCNQRVSILVLVDQPLQLSLLIPLVQYNEVSILVLVDQPLQP